MPATYAAVLSVMEEAAHTVPNFAPISVLDLGSGPGTALWAAVETFRSLGAAHAVERDANLAELGKGFVLSSDLPLLRTAKWDIQDLRTWRGEKKHDLVVASYALGELTPHERHSLISRAWESCQGILAVVEPGTRAGFGVVVEVRQQLLELGASLAAPCPHSQECPMKTAGDWCHFSVRVERSAEHRRLKQGELGYEDEKFSYVIASRLPARAAQSRVVRHPLRFSGHTKLQLCTVQGLQERTVTRSEKDLYRKVKRIDWGSAWEE